MIGRDSIIGKCILFFVLGKVLLFSCTGYTTGERNGKSKSVFYLNKDEYLEAPAVDILFFHNNYPVGKQSGIEIIQKDQRLASCGNVRIEPYKDELIAPFPSMGRRKVDHNKDQLSIDGTFSRHKLDYRLNVEPQEKGIRVSLKLDKPLQEHLKGKVHFNIELFPGAYYGKSYVVNDTTRQFPQQAIGDVEYGGYGQVKQSPMAVGRKISVAPEDPSVHITFQSLRGKIALIDGRLRNQDNWFIIRSEVPVGTKGKVVDWLVKPHVDKEWRHEPVVGYSQIGYHSSQKKIATIEVDKHKKNFKNIKLIKLLENGKKVDIKKKKPISWGDFLRYHYGKFDFSDIQSPGLYYLKYGGQQTRPFRIGRGVLDRSVWEPTLHTFLSAQMAHMKVRDRLRVWHGKAHMDDGMQAPVNHVHFDGYRQLDSTETQFKSYEHISGLNSGGWYDAGDFDLAAGSQAKTIYYLALAREEFDLRSDQTSIDQELKYTRLHYPDGKNDVLQQIEHGLLNLLSGYQISGHCYPGIIANNFLDYVHQGAPDSQTDNYIYNPELDTGEIKNGRSGVMDDRFVFTNRHTALEYLAARTFSLSSRVLGEYKPKLAKKCLKWAENIWKYEKNHQPVTYKQAYAPDDYKKQKILAAIELYITTKKDEYLQYINNRSDSLSKRFDQVAWRLISIKNDLNKELRTALKEWKNIYASKIDSLCYQNPFNVPYSKIVIEEGEGSIKNAKKTKIWGVGWDLQEFAVRYYHLYKANPETFDKEKVLAVVNYIFGKRPGSNISMVSGIGNRSLTTAFGYNRADWSYIPGGVVSGTALIRPDFPELKHPYPYLWQQTEYVIRGAASYIYCINAARNLLKEKRRSGD